MYTENKFSTNEYVCFSQDYPGKFRWFGEINVFKHALAANGFFHDKRVTVDRVEKGEYDDVFEYATRNKFPVTLHCDLG